MAGRGHHNRMFCAATLPEVDPQLSCSYLHVAAQSERAGSKWPQVRKIPQSPKSDHPLQMISLGNMTTRFWSSARTRFVLNWG